MIKILSGLVLLSSISFASTYYAKVEPISTYNVKASISGKVVYVNNIAEATSVEKDTIVKIDSKINKIDLKQSSLKLKSLKDILTIENSTLKSFNRVSSKSKFDKDNQKIKILNVTSSIADLETKIETLKDVILNKTLVENNKYIYNISVEVGDFVNPGVLLYTAMDLSKGKLIVYIPFEESKTIQEKEIYLDGIKTDLKISKLYTIADSKHISSFKCEITINNPEKFSKLTKIEFK